MDASAVAAAGEIWASFLEHLSAGDMAANSKGGSMGEEEDALNDLMRLSNTVQRSNGNQVLLELQGEAEERFRLQITSKLQFLAKQSVAQIRNGNVQSVDQDLSRMVRFLRLRLGLDLISSSNSGAKTTEECRAPIKQVLLTLVTVKCVQIRDNLRKELDLLRARRKGNTNTSEEEELGFVDAVEASVNACLSALQFVHDARALLSPSNEKEESSSFVNEVQVHLCDAASNQVQQIMLWFIQERQLSTLWRKRAKELGGLTLPRALSAAPSAPVLRGLDDGESTLLSIILHELSEMLFLSQELLARSKVLEDLALDCTSHLVTLDELWLTHNFTKAVSHSESIESELKMTVNSIAEDVFHIANTSLARAEHSGSHFASEATANHVAGFISDGFLEILSELVRRDAMLRAGEDGKVSAELCEALNTVSACILFSQDLEREMESGKHVMGKQLMGEAVQRMTVLLDDAVHALCLRALYQPTAPLLHRILRTLHYEIQPGSATTTTISGTSWIQDLVALEFTNNAALEECFQRLSPRVLKQVVEELILKYVCTDALERACRERLRFNALGALQFETDIRALCESITTECARHGREDLDFEIRKQFARLRHWAFLLNLERAAEEQEIPYPVPALTREEIALALTRRSDV